MQRDNKWQIEMAKKIEVAKRQQPDQRFTKGRFVESFFVCLLSSLFSLFQTILYTGVNVMIVNCYYDHPNMADTN